MDCRFWVGYLYLPVCRGLVSFRVQEHFPSPCRTSFLVGAGRFSFSVQEKRSSGRKGVEDVGVQVREKRVSGMRDTESVQGCHYVRHLVVGHGGVEWQAEFLASKLFGDGKGKLVVLLVARLLVGWNGVVDEGLDAVVAEVLLQGVAVGGEDGEDVIDVVAFVHQGG